MGTRTYSRRGANGTRVLTALGRKRAAGVAMPPSVYEEDLISVLPQDIVSRPAVTTAQIQKWTPEMLRAWRVVKTQAASTLRNSPDLRGLRQSDDDSDGVWESIRSDMLDYLKQDSPRNALALTEDVLRQLGRDGSITDEVIYANPSSPQSMEPNYTTRERSTDMENNYAPPIVATLLMLRRVAQEIEGGKREIARFGGMRYGVDAQFREGYDLMRNWVNNGRIDLEKIRFANQQDLS